MIKRAEEMVREIRENMRDGSGSVEILHIFQGHELKGRARLCAKITLEPGCSIGFHHHDDEEEIFYIIRGKGIVDDDGNKVEVAAGDAVLTGGGRGHAIANNGSESLEIMAVILTY
ncbi:MAG: cupin domain-containing protein [Firmicutes bacterium]|nr:cupin domain-containing protein [Bacillota bacterium]